MSDNEIVRLLRDPATAGEGACLLFAKYENLCMRNAVRLTSEAELARELAYDALARLVHHESDSRTASFREGASLGAYLFATMRNAYRDHIRKRGRQPTIDVASAEAADGIAALPSDQMDVLSRIIVREGVAVVRECISRLSDEDQRVLMLRYGDDPQTLQQIATCLGVVVSTAKYKIDAALARLKQRLEQAGVQGVFDAGSE